MQDEQQEPAGEDTVVQDVQVLDNTLIHQLKADIDVQISTAKAYPRDIKKFHDRAMSMATLTPAIAESCNFGVPRGGKIIQGPSVRLAEIIFSNYGNLRGGARVVMNDGRWVTAQGVMHDMETNVFMSIEVKKSIMQHEKKWVNGKSVKTGRMVQMNDDMQTLIGAVCCSIAFRNVTFKVVPKGIWFDIYEEAKKVALGSAATLVDRRNKALDYFRGLGIKDEQICAALEISHPDNIDLEKLAQLTAFKTSMNHQESKLEDLFPSMEELKSKGKQANKATEDKLKKGAGLAGTVEKLADDLADDKKKK